MPELALSLAFLGLFALVPARDRAEGTWYTVYDGGSRGNAATPRFADGKASHTVIDRAAGLPEGDF